MRLLKKLILKKSCVAFFICISLTVMYLPATTHAEEAATFATGQIYNGFKLVEDKPLSEINSNALVFEHVKSGARLLYLQNDDENKVFSISFYTPPSDDTGVNHVIEHSVLYGSEKYPVKSPLMQVLKDSVSNFANALTFSDRTEYPFATNNYKDFKNLLGIYMDAVFYPNFRYEPKIFSQEGWHYELNSKDSDLSYNGVVYNEMKGNYSSPDVLLQDNVMKSLFPNTLYNFESGGDPEVIPQLTRDKALETYNKYYTPSNSYIYLSGKLDILDTLKFLDEQYLSKFDKKTIDSTIPTQKPFNQRTEKDADYAVPVGSDTNNKTYLSLNYAINVNGNSDDIYGLQLLNAMLLSSNSSILSNAIIQNGFGSSAQGSFNVNLAEPVFQIQVSGANEQNKDNYTKFIDAALTNIAKGGIDKNTIDSVFNSAEISLRAQKTVGSRGLNFDEDAIAGWMYYGNPTTYLESEKSFANIKKSIDSGYFENLIQKYFIDNKHSSLVVLKPKAGLQEEMDANAKKTLADFKSKLSDSEIDSLVKQTKDLKAWQDTPDTKEALSSIPTLSLSDINTNTSTTPLIEKDVDGVKVLDHPIYTNKLDYMNMYFDSSTVSQDKLPYLYLLSDILGQLGTEKHSSAEVYSKELNIGGLSFTPYVIPKFENDTVYYPKFIVSCNTLGGNLPDAMNLISEIINTSKFDDKEQLKTTIKSLKSGLTSYITNDPSNTSTTKVQSYFSPLGQYNETGDLQFYNFVSDLDTNFDSKADEIIKNLKDVSSLVFNKENLTVGITADDNEYDKFQQSLTTLLNQIGDSKLQTYSYKFDDTAKNEGLMIPSQVQYIAEGYNINKLGYKYSGNMLVLSKILTTEYLMNEVREKGGAYGTSFSISPQGNALFTSYRDPNLKETLDTFDKAGDFLRNFKADDSQMTSYILGIVNSKDASLDPSSRGTSADIAYISGETMQDAEQISKEILNTKSQDISAYANMIDAITKQSTYCVIGNDTKIQENKDLFTNVTDVLNDQNNQNNKEHAKQLLETAKSTLLVANYINAYTEISKLSQTDQQALMPDLISLKASVLTPDITNILNTIVALHNDPSISNSLEIVHAITDEVKLKENQTYLFEQLNNVTFNEVFTPDVTAAFNAVNDTRAKKDTVSIQLAKDTIAKVKNKGSEQWLTDYLTRALSE